MLPTMELLKLLFPELKISQCPECAWVTHVSISRRSPNFLERRLLKRRIRGPDLGATFYKGLRPDTWYLCSFYVLTCLSYMMDMKGKAVWARMSQNNDRGAALTAALPGSSGAQPEPQRALDQGHTADQSLCFHCPSLPRGLLRPYLLSQAPELLFHFLLISPITWSSCPIPVSADDITSYLTQMREGIRQEDPPPPASNLYS